jgi:hypothetical protein
MDFGATTTFWARLRTLPRGGNPRAGQSIYHR